MKTLLLILLLALLGFGLQAQTMRGPVTTTTFTRSLLTNDTATSARSALGVSVDGITTNGAAYGTTTFELVVATNFTGNANGLTNLHSSIIIAGGSGAISAQTNTANTYYVPLGGWGFTSQVTALHRWKLPYSVMITNCWCVNDTGLGAGTNVVFQIWTNGVATGFTASTTGAGTSTPFICSNLTSSVVVPAGVYLHMSTSNNCASAPAGQLISWTLEAVKQ